ncbi:HNH endonuclease signature motif containing protein [Paraburkholderia nodosa]|uniref:HNH endonuclease signature motif containing protein n=1 Tax=Paraburkholderia nodosa TaxID=392320 RepID=UPI00048A0425|nr:HNH endonuclease signature motif containing protein [Paraburkholderia nodosa]
MIELWEGPCAVTGAYTLRALVASHAKPWTDSTDVEKLNPSNGLLLAGTLDKVYDGYLMSVHPETGELLFSDAIDEAERARLGGTIRACARHPRQNRLCT